MSQTLRNSITSDAVHWLRENQKIKGKIGAVGYGPGAAQVLRLLNLTTTLKSKQHVEKPAKIDAGFIADPGIITNQDVKAIRGPLSIAVGKSVV